MPANDDSPPSASPDLAEGAEARVVETDYLDLRAVRKIRVPKLYREPGLDARLREDRIRTEVRLLRAARDAGVRTPYVLDLDRISQELVLEKIEGIPLTRIFTGPAPEGIQPEEVAREFGRSVGRLHEARISHGDLTGSNALWTGTGIALIDFSLGSRQPELEDLGIDLHLVEEDLRTLSAEAERLYEAFLTGYRDVRGAAAEEVLQRSREIQQRVRYA
jgi:Kae1-associated kinase Bud32